jgi:hypothetical protein
VSGSCTPSVTSSPATLAISPTNTWLGTTSSDWNNGANWCSGVPTSTTDVAIPSGTPNAPTISAAADARNITIGTGATLTLGAGGTLNLYGNLVTNGVFNSTAGTIAFRGAANQNVGALSVTNLIMNGAGGVTLADDLTVSGTVTLTQGNITLGNSDMTMTGNTAGSVSSHIVTNGTGRVTVNNIGAGAVNVPVGPSAASYNPVQISNGDGKNYQVHVLEGINPAIQNPLAAINRTWTIIPNTQPAAPFTVSFNYADAHGNANVNPTANKEVGRYAAGYWVLNTPAGGIAPTGTAAARQVTIQTLESGAFVIGNVGAIGVTTTGTPTVDPDITGVTLMPNVITDEATIRVVSQRTMKITWIVTDANGRIVKRFTSSVSAGQNDVPVLFGSLSNGMYYLHGITEKGRISVQPFVRK